MSVMLCRPDGDAISEHNSVSEAQTVAAGLIEIGAVISWCEESPGRYVGEVGGDAAFVIEENADGGDHGHA